MRKRFKVFYERWCYAEECWQAPMARVTNPLLVATYDEFRLPLNLRPPELFLLQESASSGKTHTLLCVFDAFEYNSNDADDLPNVVLLVERLAQLSTGHLSRVALLDEGLEVLIVKVEDLRDEIAAHIRDRGSPSAAVDDA